MEKKATSIAVLVVSCDRYADIWPTFVRQFRRYWADCPFAAYIATNRLDPKIEGFTTIMIGDDLSWSDNLRKALDSIPEEYVLLFLEDLILSAPVDGALLAKVVGRLEALHPDNIKLNATEKPDEYVDELLGRAREGAMYRTSTVLSLWRKERLRSLLKPGESAWAFELAGSYRSDAYPGFYSTWKDCFPVVNGVIKGKWRRDAVALLAAQGVAVDLKARREMSRTEALLFAAKQARSMFFKLVPMRYRRAMHRRLTGYASR
jgi:hypothetical protein